MTLCSVASVMFDSATLWTAARQAPLSMRFSRQESWSGLPCPPPGDLPDPGIKPALPELQGDSFYHWATGEAPQIKPASDTKHGKFLRQISSEEGHYLQHMIHELIFLYIKRTENQSGKDRYPNRKLSAQTIRRAGEGREGWSKRTQKDVFPP